MEKIRRKNRVKAAKLIYKSNHPNSIILFITRPKNGKHKLFDAEVIYNKPKFPEKEESLIDEDVMHLFRIWKEYSKSN